MQPMPITNREKKRREEFLRVRGAYSAREQRVRTVQRMQLRARISELSNKIEEFSESLGNRSAFLLCSAWRSELIEKHKLLARLYRGDEIPQTEVDARISEIAVLRADRIRTTSRLMPTRPWEMRTAP